MSFGCLSAPCFRCHQTLWLVTCARSTTAIVLSECQRWKIDYSQLFMCRVSMHGHCHVWLWLTEFSGSSYFHGNVTHNTGKKKKNTKKKKRRKPPKNLAYTINKGKVLMRRLGSGNLCIPNTWYHCWRWQWVTLTCVSRTLSMRKETR